MNNHKKYSQKQHNSDQLKILKLKRNIQKYESDHPEGLKKVQKETDILRKLSAMNSLIGFLVRKGHDSGLPMEILIDIANDYEKRLEKD